MINLQVLEEMSQSKKQSAVETVIGTFVGILTSMVTQAIIYPMYGFQVTFMENVGITFIFTVVSLVRGYLIRRFFNNMKK